MKKINLDHLDDLAVGCSILGSGGGGDPHYLFMMARYEMEKRGSVSLVSCAELKPDDLILCVGYIGAPCVEQEKIPHGGEFINLCKMVEEDLGKKVTVLMPYEVGGSNAFVPLMAAAQLGLPILDADTMGRAFPETQMTSCHLYGIKASPAYMSDCLGNNVKIEAKNIHALEKIARHITIAMGSSAGLAIYPLNAEQVKKCVLHKTISKAIAIGKGHREAKKRGRDPLEDVLNICKGVCLSSGQITDIDRVISNGFVYGHIHIQNKNEKIEIAVQNEYLIAKCNEKIIATTPDILMILEQETGTPITTEWLQYGLKVNLIAIPSPALWMTPEGLGLVGPRVFGYDVDYQPIIRKCEPHKEATPCYL
jgi:hypothetical protein